MDNPIFSGDIETVDFPNNGKGVLDLAPGFRMFYHFAAETRQIEVNGFYDKDIVQGTEAWQSLRTLFLRKPSEEEVK